VAIVLVRHGETPGNAARVIQRPETPLSPRGVAQAQRLADRLAAWAVSTILSSDYARARMTAAALQAATGVPLDLDPDLRERNFGDLRGTAYADLDVDPFAPGYVPPRGESWDDLHARVDRVWARVTATAVRQRGDVVVVTHGLVCHSLVARHLALEAGAAEGGFGNTSVTIVEGEPPWRVRLLNCTAHLDTDTAHDTRTRSGL
jgi:probable phosphoglycerate mutase